MTRHISDEWVCLRYIYIIEADNRGKKSRFFGKTKVLYTGTTINLMKRYAQHIQGINSPYLNKNFRFARKTLVYVEYFVGDKWGAERRELEVKHLKTDKRTRLIASEENQLVQYVPLKAVILKKHGKPGEQICLTFDGRVL